jgi:predicted phage replisome organizer
MAEVKWIKLATDIFDNRKIRQIEQMPDGDALIVVWLKLLTLAGATNDQGYVYFTQEIPYTDQLLATQFNKPISLIQLALSTFERFNMIDIVDDIIHVSNWERYQNIEGMDKIREQTRKRVAKHREKKMLETNEDCNVTCNVTVTQCNATDKEEDKDIDKEYKYYSYQNNTLSTKVDNSNSFLSEYSQDNKLNPSDIVDLYHKICKSYPRIRSISESRKKAINARLRTHSIEEIKEVFEKAEKSSFLKGANNRNWAANFDWLINETNFCKVLDGNYDNKCSTSKPQSSEAKEIRFSSEELDRLFGGGS